MDKSNRNVALFVIVTLGLFDGVIALSSVTVLIPAFDNLEPVTINSQKVHVNESPSAGFGGILA